MSVYLDHNATTPPDEAVVDAMLPYLRGCFGNPSSLHRLGRLSRQAISHARMQIADLVGVHDTQVIFTSGGTESNNLAIRGVSPHQLLVSAIEHASVLMPARAWSVARGRSLHLATVDAQGVIDRSALQDQLADMNVVRGRSDTGLLSVMMANNETGVLQDMAALSELARGHDYWLHCDAAQAVGRVPVDFVRSGVQLMTLSAHKMYGPKGVGALIVDRAVVLQAQMLGGGHEFGLRAGTENLASIVGFGVAAERAKQQLGDHSRHLMGLCRRLETQLKALPVIIFSALAERIPNTVCLSVPGMDGETLVMNLDLEGLAVSSGSACDSGGRTPSHVLMAMGVPADLATCAIRISLGAGNTEHDVDFLVEKLRALMARLQGASGSFPVATAS